ncbi:MAG: hypothetical protein H6624_05210 [Bdellovibrionaceae bacterium]|nr:hypothetical protein [Bdellovibrionales bacterium]MCB9083717.1 hypothetical protein [Pseudobdellovibrionaceae bacterium]
MSHADFKMGADLWSQFLAELGPNAFLVGPLCASPPANSGPTIYVDGGARWFREPGISIGDGDSWDEIPQVLLYPDKDVSDLGFVLRSLPLTVRLLELVGFLGGDRDHELFNLGEIHRFLGAQSGRVAHMDQSVLGFSSGTWQLEHEGVFSLLSLAHVQVQIQGEVEFPVDLPIEFHPLDSRGLSNESRGLISLTTTGPIFIFLR